MSCKRKKQTWVRNGKTPRQWLNERQQELDDAQKWWPREQDMIEREAAAEARSKELTKVREESLAEREQRLQCQLAEMEGEKREIQDRLTSLDEDRAAWDERNERLQIARGGDRNAASRDRSAAGTVLSRYRAIDRRQNRAEERLTEVERREAKIADWESRLQPQSEELEKQTEALRQRRRRSGNRPGRAAQNRSRTVETRGRTECGRATTRVSSARD